MTNILVADHPACGPKFSRSAASLLCCFLFILSSIVGVCSPVKTNAVQGTVSNTAEEKSEATENSGVPVEIDGRAILLVYVPVAGMTAQERADAIKQRIIALSHRRLVTFESIHAEDRGAWSEILAGADRIMAVTEGDAKAADRPRNQLAAEYTEIIRLVVRQYRDEHTWRRFLWGVL